MLYDDRLDGRIDVHRYDSKSAEILREIELVDEQLADLDSSPIMDILSNAGKIIELAQNANMLFLRAPEHEKSEFLRKLLSNCVLEKGSVKPEFQHPLGVLLDTNAKWKDSGAVTCNISALHSIWHPKSNSNCQPWGVGH